MLDIFILEHTPKTQLLLLVLIVSTLNFHPLTSIDIFFYDLVSHPPLNYSVYNYISSTSFKSLYYSPDPSYLSIHFKKLSMFIISVVSSFLLITTLII
jgi:hypothetical protein